MSIQEQIKIARMIASGTPREVAILESSAIEKSGQTIDVDATEVKDTPQEKDTKVSYGVFSTQYSDKYAYFISSTSEIQNKKSS